MKRKSHFIAIVKFCNKKKKSKSHRKKVERSQRSIHEHLFVFQELESRTFDLYM